MAEKIHQIVEKYLGLAGFYSRSNYPNKNLVFTNPASAIVGSPIEHFEDEVIKCIQENGGEQVICNKFLRENCDGDVLVVNYVFSYLMDGKVTTQTCELETEY